MQADFTLDLRGESCPYPVIYTMDALKDMEKGQLLMVVTDCPSSFRNIPQEIKKSKYCFAQEPIKNGQEFLFYIYA
ncbi:sulfurtransferase-like selenium metabolism protein YedF [Virgibacillus sp. 179-BFC.A HS]|uniref:Sulfurtransferase-like selenium metabolism protein YedF n=1 Tax=Tigheibacillus jepli TaxID=3035914 RepID=A0ABU5CDM8_9BACI|nr:sulfurtransferase-like selenium metabolism protein YedF [Virgibacillus sp. 179-BFC.A HS]MDY0404386.1 sulfurtransferase-like selenium metabolism protein YedF [Virgibacillus sp. 179-BFC.A HS]